MKPLRNSAVGFLAVSVIALLGIASVPSVRAGEKAKHPAKPLLWKVEGNGLEKPSYLFGTIHLGDPAVTTLHPAARKAFEESEALYTEVPMDVESQMAIVPMIMRKDGKTLDGSIGGELSKRLDEELKIINPALDSTPFQPMATWMAGMTLPLLADQMAGRKALDLVLWEEAANAGKSTAGIETAESQIGIFAEMTEEDQTAMLSESLRMLKKERDEGTDTKKEMLAAYVSGETDQINAVLDKGMAEMKAGPQAVLSEKFMKRLLDDRNVTMAETIAGILKKEPGKSHFFAVGSGHLTTAASIRSHLEVAGYTVIRIGE